MVGDPDIDLANGDGAQPTARRFASPANKVAHSSAHSADKTLRLPSDQRRARRRTRLICVAPCLGNQLLGDTASHRGQVLENEPASAMPKNKIMICCLRGRQPGSPIQTAT